MTEPEPQTVTTRDAIRITRLGADGQPITSAYFGGHGKIDASPRDPCPVPPVREGVLHGFELCRPWLETAAMPPHELTISSELRQLPPKAPSAT